MFDKIVVVVEKITYQLQYLLSFCFIGWKHIKGEPLFTKKGDA